MDLMAWLFMLGPIFAVLKRLVKISQSLAVQILAIMLKPLER
jgi:hypothetical protein